MERSPEPIVQQFLQLDLLDLQAVLATIEPRPRMVG
jgi:hypothetical protein